ncbi:DUF4269 domain-containing protein [Bacillus spongiae]|uniref:DUF4269 domain-containing protein n=1 Tax=Bacillus spongiae TaxID=2683610 RepID=A0ABU8HIY4_9BACI
MIDFLEKMQKGSMTQQRAYRVIKQLDIFTKLSSYTPILCGTLPIGIDIEGSDLDIIMNVQRLDDFERQIHSLYHHHNEFRLKRTVIRGKEIVKANFIYQQLEFELFGQAQPVHQQYAYLHMMIEEALLKKIPYLKENVMTLKKQGYKTEPAFCKILGITGDPYTELIQFGISEGIIKNPYSE